MADSRIQLTCRYCGGSIFIGKGGFGRYITCNEDIFRHLNEFYRVHANGDCVDASDYSNDAKKFFVILEEGETLSDILPPVDVDRITAIRESVIDVLERVDRALDRETPNYTVRLDDKNDFEDGARAGTYAEYHLALSIISEIKKEYEEASDEKLHQMLSHLD